MRLEKGRILWLTALCILLAGSAARGYTSVCAPGQLPTVTDFALTGPSEIIGASTQSFSATVNISCYPGGEQWSVDFSTSPPGILDMPGGETLWGAPATLQGNAPGVVSQPTAVTITAWTGEGGVNTPSSSITVTVVPFTVSIAVSPASVQAGNKGSGTVTLNAPIWASSQTVNVYPNPTDVIGPAVGVPIYNGQTTGQFSFSASSVSQPASVLLTAVLGSSSTTSVLVSPPGEGPNASNLGPCKSCAAQAGAPINLSTGNVWVQQPDYSVPGLGSGLKIVRTWNSQWQDNSPVSLAGMFGNSWWSNYEERLQVLSSDALVYWRGDGSAWTFAYNSATQTYSMASPPDERAALQFNSITGQFDLTLSDGSQRIFSQPGYLQAIIDRNGNQTSLTYDGSNRLTQVTDAGGAAITFTYGDPNNPKQATTVQDSVGTIANYTYDSSSRLTQVKYSDGSILNFTYDPSSSMITSVTDAQGKVVEAHTYDNLHRGLTSQRANGFDQVTVSYPGYGQTDLSDSMGDTTTYGYEFIGGRMFLTSVTGPGCASCGGRGNNTFTYDGTGNLTSSTDALGYATNYTYDAEGNVLSKSVQLNSTATLTWSYTYNTFNEILTATDPEGNVTTNTYDSKGNLLSTTTPSPGGSTPGSTTSFSYDTKGELTKVTDPLGNATTIGYNSVGLVASVTDAQNNVTSFQYDGRENRTSITDALSETTKYAYDPMSRLTKITYADGSTAQFGYDYRGRRTSVTDADTETTSYGYDDADHLTSVTDAAGNITAYGYDTENRLASITDAAGHVTNFSYDPLGRVTKVTFPSTLTESYTYDADGNLLTKADRNGQTISYAYDGLNRLSSKTYPDSTSVNYTYDNLSQLIQATDPTGTYSFSYDNMSRLASATEDYSFLGGSGETVSYTYDAASNRLSMTDPQSAVATYAYDTLNRLASLTGTQDQKFTFAYDALSRRTSLARPNGIDTSYNYDALSHLLAVAHQLGGSTIDGTSYTYDPAGNRLSMTAALPQPPATSTFGYDAIYELTQVTKAGTSTETYTYDAVGNRLSSLGLSPYQYNSSNELTSTPKATYTYDNDGNTLTKTDSTGTTSYSWDFENRLASAALPGSGGTVSFKYDPFGRRIEKIGPNGTTVYIYDGDNVIEDLDGNGGVTAKFTQGLGIDEPLALYESGQSYFYEADGLGSITSLTDSTGKVAQTYTYDSFGNVTASTGSVSNPFQYTGREFDSETGLYYYRARYYNPINGRFLSEDPIGFGGGFNKYVYVQNSPVDLYDPFGLFCIKRIMLVTAYNDKGPGSDWNYYEPKNGGSPGEVGPGTVAVGNTNPLPYPYGSDVTVYDYDGKTVLYNGRVHDTGAGWNKQHHDVEPDQWIDIWLPGRQANQWGLKFTWVKICYDNGCGSESKKK